MIILRTLLKLKMVQYIASSSPDSFRDASLKAVADAVYTYVSLEKILLNAPIYPTNGVTPGPVTALGTVGANFTPASKDVLYNKLDLYTKDSIPFVSPRSMEGMFRAFSEWLSIPVMTVNILQPGIPFTGITGVGTINFPLMGGLGVPCWSTMVGLGIVRALDGDGVFDSLDRSFEILSNFIYAGLLANIIPPIVVVDASVTYSGLAYPVWLPIDLPDWPVGSIAQSALQALLAQLGLSSLDDLEDLDYPVETPIGKQACTIAPTNSGFEFWNDAACDFEDQDVEDSKNDQAGYDVDTLDELFDQIDDYADQIENTQYPESPYIITDTIPVEINIVINRPIIKAEFNDTTVGFDPQSLLKTGFK